MQKYKENKENPIKCMALQRASIWTANTGPFGNNTSVDQKVNRKPNVEALVGDPKALNQEETDSVDELIKLNETSNEPIHNV